LLDLLLETDTGLEAIVEPDLGAARQKGIQFFGELVLEPGDPAVLVVAMGVADKDVKPVPARPVDA
jgi:hypothetical protein